MVSRKRYISVTTTSELTSTSADQNQKAYTYHAYLEVSAMATYVIQNGF